MYPNFDDFQEHKNTQPNTITINRQEINSFIPVLQGGLDDSTELTGQRPCESNIFLLYQFHLKNIRQYEFLYKKYIIICSPSDIANTHCGIFAIASRTKKKLINL